MPPSEASTTVDPVLTERGQNYELWDNQDGTFTWKSAPHWVWGGSEFVPYVYGRDDAKKCYRVQTAGIGAEVYDSGVAVFCDVGMTEQRVKSEVWEVWDVIGGKKAGLGSPVVFGVVQNSSGVYVNATRATSKPSGTLSIVYWFRVGGGLKHWVFWKSNEPTTQTVEVKQVWDLAESITKCNVDGEEVMSGVHDGTRFLLYSEANPYLVFEDQTAMLDKFQPATVDFAGKKMVFTFSGWTLANGEALAIDPDTDTWQVGVGTDDCQATETSFDTAGSTNRVGRYDSSWSYRTGHRFTSVSIPQAATIDSAYLKPYRQSKTGEDTIYSKIKGQDSDDTSAFSSLTNYNNRPRTTAAVDWDGAFSTSGWITSPDIKTVIQEIVDRGGWVSGNSLVIFWENDGTPVGNYIFVRAYEYSGLTYGVKLEVTWSGESTNPTYSDVGKNTTLADQVCLFYAKWTDNVNMSGYIFGTNNTGTWSNDTWSGWSPVGTPEWSNVTKTLNSTVGITVQWCIWANDTSDNWNNTGTQSLTTTSQQNFVTLNSPTDESTETSYTVQFKFTPTFYQDIENASLWTNENGWSLKEWNTTTVQNGTLTTITEVFGSEGQFIWNVQVFNSTDSVWAASNFTVNVYVVYCVVFYGLYNETTGLLMNSGVNVTAYFTDGTAPDTFEVNGTYSYGWQTKPQYFVFDLGDKDRQYWLQEQEDNATIYIFDDTPKTTYTIEFLDLGGVTDERPIVESQYYVNGTAHTIERRKIDVEPKIVMNLVNGRKYVIQLKDGVSYTFGELLMTSDATVSLTLKGIEFPQDNLLTFRWVQIYCGRTFGNPNGNITVTYEDLQNATVTVDIYITYRNGTYAYGGVENADSFIHTWTSALNNTDYTVNATITHASLGTLTAKWFLPRSLTTAPWSLDFLGTLPFATSTLLPMFLVLCFAGLFSALNAPLGAFLTVMATIILVYLGWITVSGGALIAALAFALMLAIVYAKRRANV